MSEWSANDYSNFITICAAAIGSTLLVLFKSRCSSMSFCWGLYKCNREVITVEETPPTPTPTLPTPTFPDNNP
jgi:hypothetical protein